MLVRAISAFMFTLLAVCTLPSLHAGGLMLASSGVNPAFQDEETEPAPDGDAAPESDTAAQDEPEPQPEPMNETASAHKPAPQPAEPAGPVASETSPTAGHSPDGLAGESAASAPGITPAAEDAAAELAAGDIFAELIAAQAAGAPPAELAAAFRTIIDKQRDKTLAKMEEKEDAGLDNKLLVVTVIVASISGVALLLLFMPLVLARKHPGKFGTLLKYSTLASVLSFAAVWLFSIPLYLLVVVQTGTGSVTNPKYQVTEAVFSSVSDNADVLAETGPVLFGEPLKQIEQDPDGSFLAMVLSNIGTLREDVKVFQSIASFFKSIDWLLGALPTVFAVVVVLLYGFAVRKTFVKLVQLPGLAAEGAGDSLGKAAVKDTMRSALAEFLSVLLQIVVLLIVAILSAMAVGIAARFAVEMLLAFVFGSIAYIASSPDVSSWGLFSAMGCVMAFLLFGCIASLLTNIFFAGKTLKIFRLKFHEKVPMFSAHGRFWGWGSLSWLWVHVLVVAIAIGGSLGSGYLFGQMIEGEEPSFIRAMVLTGLALLAGAGVIFWAARGLKGMLFIIKYKPQPAGVAPIDGYSGDASAAGVAVEVAEQAAGNAPGSGKRKPDREPFAEKKTAKVEKRRSTLAGLPKDAVVPDPERVKAHPVPPVTPKPGTAKPASPSPVAAGPATGTATPQTTPAKAPAKDVAPATRANAQPQAGAPAPKPPTANVKKSIPGAW